MREIQNSKPTEREPVFFRLISPSGHPIGTYRLAVEAASAASGFWPGVGRDEGREGWGWDIEPTRTTD